MGQDPAVPVGQVTAPVAVASRAVEACDQDAAYDPDRPCAPAPTLGAAAPVVVTTASGCDPDAAYDPSHPCPHTTAAATQDVPVAVASRSSLYQHAAPVASASAPAATAPAALISVTANGGAWAIQVGAFSSQVQAREIANGVHEALADLLTYCSDRAFADLRLWREGFVPGAPQQSVCQCSKRCLRQTGGQPTALHGCRSRAGAVAIRSCGAGRPRVCPLGRENPKCG